MQRKSSTTAHDDRGTHHHTHCTVVSQIFLIIVHAASGNKQSSKTAELLHCRRQGSAAIHMTVLSIKSRVFCYVYVRLSTAPYLMALEATCDVGLYELAVMGQNFALNMASIGFRVAVCK